VCIPGGCDGSNKNSGSQPLGREPSSTALCWLTALSAVRAGVGGCYGAAIDIATACDMRKRGRPSTGGPLLPIARAIARRDGDGAYHGFEIAVGVERLQGNVRLYARFLPGSCDHQACGHHAIGPHPGPCYTDACLLPIGCWPIFECRRDSIARRRRSTRGGR